jgi:hypothetical protein
VAGEQARRRRLADNERVFREFNVDMKRAAEELGSPSRDGRVRFLCECSDTTCIDRVYLTPDEYHRIRSNERWFVIACGHEIADIEDVVEDHGRFCIVEKHESLAA